MATSGRGRRNPNQPITAGELLGSTASRGRNPNYNKEVELYDGTKAKLGSINPGLIQGADGRFYPQGYDKQFTGALTGNTYTASVDDMKNLTKTRGGRGNPVIAEIDPYELEASVIKRDGQDWQKSELEKQKTYIEQQRANAEQEKAEQIKQFNEKEAAAKKAAEDQKAAFEADKIAREKAFNEAAALKARQLGIQRAGNGATMLEDYARVRDGAESKLVAAEDKKQLTADDKDKMFGDSASSDVVKKVKQTFLEKLRSK